MPSKNRKHDKRLSLYLAFNVLNLSKELEELENKKALSDRRLKLSSYAIMLISLGLFLIDCPSTSEYPSIIIKTGIVSFWVTIATTIINQELKERNELIKEIKTINNLLLNSNQK